MTEPIKPALTPQQWLHVMVGQDLMTSDHTFRGQDRHGLAAAALYGQPFGFTREDVAVLRASAEDDQAAYDNYEQLRGIADRIASLLPPEK